MDITTIPAFAITALPTEPALFLCASQEAYDTVTLNNTEWLPEDAGDGRLVATYDEKNDRFKAVFSIRPGLSIMDAAEQLAYLLKTYWNYVLDQTGLMPDDIGRDAAAFASTLAELMRDYQLITAPETAEIAL